MFSRMRILSKVQIEGIRTIALRHTFPIVYSMFKKDFTLCNNRSNVHVLLLRSSDGVHVRVIVLSWQQVLVPIPFSGPRTS